MRIARLNTQKKFDSDTVEIRSGKEKGSSDKKNDWIYISYREYYIIKENVKITAIYLHQIHQWRNIIAHTWTIQAEVYHSVFLSENIIKWPANYSVSTCQELHHVFSDTYADQA